jgi:ketosteroid isomerase-like protein
VVVDPRVEPALAFPLHQGLTFRGGRIVLIQDYPDRATALADLIP